MIRRTSIILCLLLAAHVRGDYVLTPESVALGPYMLDPGTTFEIDLVLTSASADTHNSAIFRVVFSSEGLSFDSYEWAAPYANGTTDDDSTPSAWELPVTLTSDMLTGPDHPVDVVDIELSNVVPSDVFESGTLVTLRLSVPEGYSGPDTVEISVVPDTIAEGFHVVPTVAGPNLLLPVPLPSWSSFGACLTGPAAPVGPGCEPMDLNTDGHVDLLDVSVYWRAYRGSL